jgi:hypothetical protein
MWISTFGGCNTDSKGRSFCPSDFFRLNLVLQPDRALTRLTEDLHEGPGTDRIHVSPRADPFECSRSTLDISVQLC